MKGGKMDFPVRHRERDELGGDEEEGGAEEVVRRGGYTLGMDALDAFISSLASRFFGAELDHESPNSSIIDGDPVNRVVCLLLEAEAAAEESPNAAASEGRGSAFRVIDAFSVPEFQYDPVEKIFYRHTGSPPIRGEASAKAKLYEDRFLLLQQRLSRDQHFAKPALETETTEFRSCEVAGAAAAAGLSGLSLADVAAEAKCASQVMGTMGVALSVCTLAGQVTSDRLGPEKMELGVGIHGEPGAAVADLQQVNAIITRVLNQILSTETGYVPVTRGDRVVLMVNGLGATPAMEIMIAAGKAVPKLQLEQGLAFDRVNTGSFMTSLDMAGFSITIMKSDESILQRLDAATKAPYWPVAVDGQYFAANRPPAKIVMPSTKSEEPLDMEDEDEEFENWETRESFLLDLPALEEDQITTPTAWVMEDQHKEPEDWGTGEGFPLPLDLPSVQEDEPDQIELPPLQEAEADQIEQLPVMQEPVAQQPLDMGGLLVAHAEFVSEPEGIPYSLRLKMFFELAIMNLGTPELRSLVTGIGLLYRRSHFHVAQEPLGNELIERAEFVANWMGANQNLSYGGMLWEFLLLSLQNLQTREIHELALYLAARLRWRRIDEMENQRTI